MEYSLQYLLRSDLVTPWSRVLVKLVVIQLLEKFPFLYGIQRFIIMFTRAYPWFLS
jgi:hypothetical protein